MNLWDSYCVIDGRVRCRLARAVMRDRKLVLTFAGAVTRKREILAAGDVTTAVYCPDGSIWLANVAKIPEPGVLVGNTVTIDQHVTVERGGCVD